MAATLTNQQLLQALLAGAYAKEILSIAYYAPSGIDPIEREVEPYSIIDMNGVSMLKAYQLAPAQGWRIFNTHLIRSVHETGKAFLPRRPIVIRVNGEVKHISPAESRDYEQIEYERAVQSAIVDLQVDTEEARKLADLRSRFGLTAEEVRGVHYRIFSDCLATVTADRIVTDEERQLLIELNSCLRLCGAGLIQ